MYCVTFRYHEHVWQGRYGTLEALALDARLFIRKHNLFASDWSDPDIYVDGRKGPLFSISYNGRIWTEDGHSVEVEYVLSLKGMASDYRKKSK